MQRTHGRARTQSRTGTVVTPASGSRPTRVIRYAVIGLGHIAQKAVLPAFANARRNSRLAALISGDEMKLEKLTQRYGVPAHSYAELDALFASDEIAAVYITLPNSMHADCAVRAANAGLHLLCEKPLAVTEAECERIIASAAASRVKLMVAYRLHFERATLEAIELVRAGRLGEVRLFDSLFCMQVKAGDIRLQADLGGGPLYDIGVYCINTARSLFRAEPEEVVARSASRRGDPRFRDVDEMTSAILRFPEDRLATFTCSFGAADVEQFRIVGTEGDVCNEPAYSYSQPVDQWFTAGARTRHRSYARRDQFGAELIYFSDCVLHDREPEPSGLEGLANVRVIRALLRSASSGKPVLVDETRRRPLAVDGARSPGPLLGTAP